MVKRNYEYKKKKLGNLKINKSVIGDSLEIMLERINEGEGVDGIQERDLVYNSDETGDINPVTNIRSDKMELMLDEKIAEQGYKKAKMHVVKNDVKDAKDEERSGQGLGEQEGTNE